VEMSDKWVRMTYFILLAMLQLLHCSHADDASAQDDLIWKSHQGHKDDVRSSRVSRSLRNIDLTNLGQGLRAEGRRRKGLGDKAWKMNKYTLPDDTSDLIGGQGFYGSLENSDALGKIWMDILENDNRLKVGTQNDANDLFDLITDDVRLGDVTFNRARRSGMKRGTGACINNCLAGGMSFVRCKSMCN